MPVVRSRQATLITKLAHTTTLLRVVSNLLPATRGRVTAERITYAGRDVGQTHTDRLVRLRLVGVQEGGHCFRALSVEENLVAGGLGRGAGGARLRHDLDGVYRLFPRMAEKRPSAARLVSGDEQQMTAIGRALMGRPRLLVLDEPSMGLAPKGGRGDLRRARRAQPARGACRCSSPSRTLRWRSGARTAP